MAEFPALPLFTDALLGDTLHLNTEQFGAYLFMLIVAWRTKDCALPNDDAYLAQITRMNTRTWNKNKGVLLNFWKVGSDNQIRQGRLVDERKYLSEKSNKNSAIARDRWLKTKETPDANAYANAVPNLYQNDTTPPHPTPPMIKTSIPERELRGSSRNGHHGPNSARTGPGLENGLNGSGQLRGFALSTDTAAWLASHAPGWDENFLAKKYMGWLNGKESPRNPQAAFRGWVKKFTKDRPPS